MTVPKVRSLDMLLGLVQLLRPSIHWASVIVIFDIDPAIAANAVFGVNANVMANSISAVIIAVMVFRPKAVLFVFAFVPTMIPSLSYRGLSNIIKVAIPLTIP